MEYLKMKIEDYLKYKTDKLINIYNKKVSCLSYTTERLNEYSGAKYKLNEILTLTNNINMWNIEIIAIKRVARINKIKLNKDVK